MRQFSLWSQWFDGITNRLLSLSKHRSIKVIKRYSCDLDEIFEENLVSL